MMILLGLFLGLFVTAVLLTSLVVMASLRQSATATTGLSVYTGATLPAPLDQPAAGRQL